MKTVNSISGGKTSAYIAAHYPADYNVFSLVRTKDKKCMFPDKKIRQIVSDKLGTEFIGTLEEDMIIYTILDLEQYIGQKIEWVTGKTFDEIILRGDKKYLPNPTHRFCTSELKLSPLFKWWQDTINQPTEFRIGFRAKETKRAFNMLNKTNSKGLLEMKAVVGKRKTRNKWGIIEWNKPVFPLIQDNIYKDKIEEYWKDKRVRFAYMNNCVGCFHRSPVLLKHMSEKHKNKFNWFIDAEKETGYKKRTFKLGMTYEQIKKSFSQTKLFDDDFNECDSGYCGL
tara:strand:- start:219 stop:1067 length:849 start_codon:yes stop_codon:yes gene_type:complete